MSTAIPITRSAQASFFWASSSSRSVSAPSHTRHRPTSFTGLVRVFSMLQSFLLCKHDVLTDQVVATQSHGRFSKTAALEELRAFMHKVVDQLGGIPGRRF